MTGAVAAAAMMGGASSGGTVTPTATSWSDIYGTDTAATNTVTLTGFSAPISISVSRSGGGLLLYVLNGNASTYTGPFTAHPGDTLGFLITTAAASGTISGTVTVTNATASATLGSFNYVVNGSGFAP